MIFENPHSSKCQEQENPLYGVTDEHIHDNKALSELVDDIIKSNKITVDNLFTDGVYVILLFLDVHQTMEFIFVFAQEGMSELD